MNDASDTGGKAMHSPLARTKVETGAAAKIEPAAPGRSGRALVIVALVIAAAAIAAYSLRPAVAVGFAAVCCVRLVCSGACTMKA